MIVNTQIARLQKIHMFDSAGKFRGPFVYGLTSERDPETYKKKFVEVKEEIYKIKFFTKGAPYKLFGFIKMDIHLYGVDAPGGVFIFGTDNMGRDMFSKIVLGSQISLTIPFVGTIISLVLGVLIGGISGYFGGITDSIIQRGSEILMSFPSLPLWMALAAAIPSDIPIVKMYLYITIILSFLGWTGLARVVRSAFLASKEQDFIMAAKVAGVSDMKIITRHLVPGFLSYLIVNMTLGIPGMIVGETSMSFLGLGIRPPAVSWGVLLQDAREISNIAMHPWTLIPLLYVIVTVLAFNFFGDGLRDAADPYK